MINQLLNEPYFQGEIISRPWVPAKGILRPEVKAKWVLLSFGLNNKSFAYEGRLVNSDQSFKHFLNHFNLSLIEEQILSSIQDRYYPTDLRFFENFEKMSLIDKCKALQIEYYLNYRNISDLVEIYKNFKTLNLSK